MNDYHSSLQILTQNLCLQVMISINALLHSTLEIVFHSIHRLTYNPTTRV